MVPPSFSHSEGRLLMKSRVPPNVKFEIDDAEQTWTWPDNFFDLVHLRTMTGCIRDWDKLFTQTFQSVNPPCLRFSFPSHATPSTVSSCHLISLPPHPCLIRPLHCLLQTHQTRRLHRAARNGLHGRNPTHLARPGNLLHNMVHRARRRSAQSRRHTAHFLLPARYQLAKRGLRRRPGA